MEIKEVCIGGYHKILSLSISSGKQMPAHYSTTDAFIIVMKGHGLLIFENKRVDLKADTTFLIPALKHHSFEAIEDLKAYLILGSKGGISILDGHYDRAIKNKYITL